MNVQQETRPYRLSRRAFIAQGSLFLAGSAAVGWNEMRLFAADDDQTPPAVRIGMATDLHYADKPPAGTRYYRETLSKLAAAAQRFEQAGIHVFIELGDLVDAADSLEAEKGYLRQIARQIAAVPGQPHYVLGNHCVYAMTKPEFLEIVGQRETYYSFDKGGWHFIVLDACFRGDGMPYGRKNFDWKDAKIPPAEVEWLREDLQRTPHKSVVFIHQRLDVENHYGVQNAPEIRKVLEVSGKVAAVFQGHYHKNDYRQLAGIHYCTLAAMIEGSGEANSAYGLMELFAGGGIRIRGFCKQQGYQWALTGS